MSDIILEFLGLFLPAKKLFISFIGWLDKARNRNMKSEARRELINGNCY